MPAAAAKCGKAPRAQAQGVYASLAISPSTGAYGYGYNYATDAQAREREIRVGVIAVPPPKRESDQRASGFRPGRGCENRGVFY